jgi:hypothetical protein
MEPVAFQIDAGCLVAVERVIIPGIPQSLDHIDELRRARMAHRGTQRRIEIVVARLIGAPAGHHVPAGARAAIWSSEAIRRANA